MKWEGNRFSEEHLDPGLSSRPAAMMSFLVHSPPFDAVAEMKFNHTYDHDPHWFFRFLEGFSVQKDVGFPRSVLKGPP